MKLTARKPTGAELAEAMSRKPVYKVVRVVGKEVLKSLWVTGTLKEPQPIRANFEDIDIFALTYARGMLSSNGRYGIWCCTSKRAARFQAGSNGWNLLCNVFQAFPIGSSIEVPQTWIDAGTVLYPSVILGKKVVEIIDNRI